MAEKYLNPLLVIVGQTASGKSALALQLAQRFSGEIICADAWTTRRQFDIGSAKPSRLERKLVPHHMIDIIDPCDSFSAADFKEMASKKVQSISGKGRLPILVGGTGLYIDSILFNYSFRESGTPLARAKLNAMEIDQLVTLAVRRGISLEGTDASNKRRLVRLIETNGEEPSKTELREKTLILGLAVEAQDLRERVEARTRTMLKQGLEKEVKELSRKYGWNIEAMKGIGYHEWQELFAGSIGREEVESKIIKDTMALARKQRTWFKRNKSIHWLTTPVNMDKAVDLITTKLYS